ncbi:MAG: hypothetical protein AAF483_28385, partial [Planctomycetota bacterium]
MAKKRTKKKQNKKPQKVIGTKVGSKKSSESQSGGQSRIVGAALLGIIVFILIAGVYILQPLLFPLEDEQLAGQTPGMKMTRSFRSGRLTIAWDSISPKALKLVSTKGKSNIAPSDYVGPSKCEACHQKNHQNWSEHPHRWMNALANEESVIGDFSGKKTISYRGGVGTFYRKGDDYRMKYEKEGLLREYRITQTIGSRFYQYYVGVGLQGPEAESHSYYYRDFVLPFGYWIDREEWVPIVHITEELDENHRWETAEQLTVPENFAAEIESSEEASGSRGVSVRDAELGLVYASSCNYCHTTFSFGDMMVRLPKVLGESLTEDAFLELSEYVAESHPSQYDGSAPPEDFGDEQLGQMTESFIKFDARDKAVSLGVSCEACHLGCREHVEKPKEVKPSFSPQHPNFHTAKELETSGVAANVNAACARCHVGNRPKFAAGMATWNSTEYSDAMQGSCYSELTCVHCHDPHKATGKVWAKTPEQDDASCIHCHSQYKAPEFRASHTHHQPGSSGDRCMNCHMPKINEGMQDVVRTHAIFSPTHAGMIEENQPNACNLCHLDK